MLTAVGKIDLDTVPGDAGRARLRLQARGSAKALARGGGAGAGPGQPAPRLSNNLIKGGLASSPPLPTLDAVCSGRVRLSGWLSSLGLGADPTTSGSGLSCKVFSLDLALPARGHSPSRGQTR